MLPSGTASFNACFNSAIAVSCSVPQTNGTLSLNRLFKGLAILAKSLIKTLQTPTVPKNILTSVTFLQGGHLSMTPTLSVSGFLPSIVHLCPTTVISSAHNTVLCPENVPPQYFIRCTTRFKF